MTNEEAIAIIRKEYLCVDRDCDIERSCGKCDLMMPSKEPILEAYNMAIKALEQEPCEDEYIKVPKKALKYRTAGMVAYNVEWLKNHFDIERTVICGVQEPKTGHCKDCKYFEYDSVAKVDEIPLIVAHEICSRWGDGCKTKEDGYCFLFEPQEGIGEE